MRQKLIGLALAMTMLVSMVGMPLAAADHVGAPTADDDINYTADSAPNIYAHAGNVEVAQHDRAEMSGPMSFYTDDGAAADLSEYGAEMNESRDTPIGVDLSKVKDERYTLFPRLSGETGNGASWTNAGNWTKSSSASGSMTISSSTVASSNVSSVTFTATAGSASEFAQATYSRPDITSDATKRVPQVGMNVESLASGAIVQVRFEDGDGDFVAMTVNESGDPSTNESVIATSTGTAYIAQERVADLQVQGSGDGTFDGIQHTRVRVMDADATVEVFWLDAAKKSEETVIDIERDTDGDGDAELTGIVDKYESGIAWTDSLDSMATWSNDAVIFDLYVQDISFPLQHIPDNHNNISLTDHPTYDGGQLDGEWRREVPAMIDLSYGNLTLLAEQTARSDRYETVEYATAVGETNFTNVSYTDSTSTFTDKGKTYTLVANLNAGEEYAVHVRQALTQPERDAITNLAAMGGPTGRSGGFFSTIWGKMIGVVGSVVTFLGLGKLLGGGS